MKRLLLVLPFLFVGCGDDVKEVTNVLPTVTAPVLSMTCRDFCGKKPDAENVSLDRIARSNKFCLIGDECFFDCPPKDC